MGTLSRHQNSTSPAVSVRKFLGQSSQLRKMNKIIFCLMGLAGIAMAGIQPGRVDRGIGEGQITDGETFKTNTAMDCWSMCKLERSCMGFVWAKPTASQADTTKYGCWLKKATPGKDFPQARNNANYLISGLRDCLY